MTYVAQACGGELLRGSETATVTRVCTNSRQAQPGDLFVALAGERFDGHDYLVEAAQKGAVAVVGDREKLEGKNPGCAVIAVGNTRQALGALAAGYRRDFNLPVIAVGGSNGKTTTKELLAAVLRPRFTVLWSEASFNNDIGVPLTLFAGRDAEMVVLEMGARFPGNIRALSEISVPTMGIVTRVADRHYVLEKGRVVWTGSSAELSANRELQSRYLGV